MMDGAKYGEGFSARYIVTGANAGIGRAIAELLAREGYSVIMACRNLVAAEQVRGEIVRRTGNRNIEVRALDLSSQASVREFVARAVAENLKIAALVNNAGMIAHSFGLSEDGFERTVATNYLGTWALTMGLLPLVEAGGAVVNTLSLSMKYVHPTRKILTPDLQSFNQIRQYALSKLGLLYFTARLTTEAPHLRIVATDPGIVGTNIIHLHRWFDSLADIFFRPFIKKPRTAARITLRALRDSRTGYIYRGRWGARPFKPTLAASLYGDWLWQETHLQLREGRSK